MSVLSDIARELDNLAAEAEQRLISLHAAADGEVKQALADVRDEWAQVRPQVSALAQQAEADLERKLPPLIQALAQAISGSL